MPAILQLDLQQIVSQALAFLVLWVVLKRYAWAPLLAVLDARRARIEDDLRKAAERHEEMVRLQQELSGRLSKIEDEARTKIQQAVTDGKRLATELQEEARTQGAALVAKSKETVELELVKARVALRDQVAQMTTDAVERILRQKLTDATDHRLVEGVLDELEQRYTRS